MLGPIAGLVADPDPRRRVVIIADFKSAGLISTLCEST
jgi:hypothetical protein